MKLGIRFAVVAFVGASLGACSGGSDSGLGGGGSGAVAGSGDAGRGGDVATSTGGTGSGGAPAASGGAEVALGGSVGAGVGGGGAGPTGGAAGSSGAAAGGAAGAAGSSGAGGAAGSSGASGAAGSSGSGGAAGSSGAGGAGGGAVSAPKCSAPTVVASNAVPRDANGEGKVTQTDVCVPELGMISSITLKYKMSKFFGDPTRQAVFAYYADYSIYNAFWVAQVMTTGGDPVTVNDKLVYVSWLEGSWPKPGGTFGTDSTGSPWWYETFSYYSGGMMRDGYVDETNAKAIYAAGFTLDNLRMVKVNGKAVLY